MKKEIVKEKDLNTVETCFQECPETFMALTLLLIQINFLALRKIYVPVRDGFARVSHDQDRLPVQEPTDINYMRKSN